MSCAIVLATSCYANANSDKMMYAGITAQIDQYLPTQELKIKSSDKHKKSVESVKYYVIGDYVNIRKSPSTKSKSLSKLFFNDSINVYEIDDDYAKIKSDKYFGYVSTKYISTNEPYGKLYKVPYASMKTWMSYKTITSKSSKQYKLQKIAYTGTYGIRMVNNRYCVALGSYFKCEIGQYFDLVLDNGEIIPCIMGDQKADIHTDSNNIITKASDCLSEFIVDSKELHKYAKRDGDISSCSDDWNSHVAKIIVYEKVVEI